MIMDKLREDVIAYLKTAFDGGNVGAGGNASNPTATELDVPLLAANSSISVSEVAGGNVMDIKLSVAGSNITGKTLRECGFYDGSDLMARFNFDGIGPFSSSDTIEFFLTLEVE
jgi:hypothetical protein